MDQVFHIDTYKNQLSEKAKPLVQKKMLDSFINILNTHVDLYWSYIEEIISEDTKCVIKQ